MRRRQTRGGGLLARENGDEGSGGDGDVQAGHAGPAWGEAAHHVAILGGESSHSRHFIAQNEQPGAVAGDVEDVGRLMLARTEHPESGVLGDLQGATEVRRLGEGDDLHAAGSGVVDDAGEGGGAVTCEDEPSHAKEGGGAEDGAEVMRVLDLVEGDPEVGPIGDNVGEEFLEAQRSSLVNGGFTAAFAACFSGRGATAAVGFGCADLDGNAGLAGGFEDFGPGTGRFGGTQGEGGDRARPMGQGGENAVGVFEDERHGSRYGAVGEGLVGLVGGDRASRRRSRRWLRR